MLSNPWLDSSGGSSDATSTSSASRSRMAFWYSVRVEPPEGVGAARIGMRRGGAVERRSPATRSPRRRCARPAGVFRPAASDARGASGRPSPRPPDAGPHRPRESFRARAHPSRGPGHGTRGSSFRRANGVGRLRGRAGRRLQRGLRKDDGARGQQASQGEGHRGGAAAHAHSGGDHTRLTRPSRAARALAPVRLAHASTAPSEADPRKPASPCIFLDIRCPADGD